MFVMKDAVKHILHTDIITRTKTTLQDLLSGVKNLFRQSNDSAGKEFSPANLNNHLKSPDEIEAEFRFLSLSQTEETNTFPIKRTDSESSDLNKPEFHFKMNVVSEAFPEYMEENY